MNEHRRLLQYRWDPDSPSLARRPEEELRKAFNGDGPERTKACLHANKEPAEETPAAANKKETNKPHTLGKDKAELTNKHPFTDVED
jgi:hypothetical protein